jgi:anti-sigma-K factor RskA
MAAAGLAIGLVAGRTLWSDAPTPASTVAQAELDTLDTRQRLGAATVVRTGSGVDLRIATTSPLDPGDGYLEVWLINSDGKRMVSVGVLGSPEAGTFPISQALLDQGYVVVDISREHFDDRPEHSGDSLVRGTLPA